MPVTGLEQVIVDATTKIAADSDLTGHMVLARFVYWNQTFAPGEVKDWYIRLEYVDPITELPFVIPEFMDEAVPGDGNPLTANMAHADMFIVKASDTAAALANTLTIAANGTIEPRSFRAVALYRGAEAAHTARTTPPSKMRVWLYDGVALANDHVLQIGGGDWIIELNDTLTIDTEKVAALGGATLNNNDTVHSYVSLGNPIALVNIKGRAPFSAYAVEDELNAADGQAGTSLFSVVDTGTPLLGYDAQFRLEFIDIAASTAPLMAQPREVIVVVQSECGLSQRITLNVQSHVTPVLAINYTAPTCTWLAAQNPASATDTEAKYHLPNVGYAQLVVTAGGDPAVAGVWSSPDLLTAPFEDELGQDMFNLSTVGPQLALLQIHAASTAPADNPLFYPGATFVFTEHGIQFTLDADLAVFDQFINATSAVVSNAEWLNGQSTAGPTSGAFFNSLTTTTFTNLSINVVDVNVTDPTPFLNKWFVFNGVHYSVQTASNVNLNQLYQIMPLTQHTIPSGTVLSMRSSALPVAIVNGILMHNTSATSVTVNTLTNPQSYVGATFIMSDNVLHTVTAATATTLNFTPAFSTAGPSFQLGGAYAELVFTSAILGGQSVTVNFIKGIGEITVNALGPDAFGAEWDDNVTVNQPNDNTIVSVAESQFDLTQGNNAANASTGTGTLFTTNFVVTDACGHNDQATATYTVYHDLTWTAKNIWYSLTQGDNSKVATGEVSHFNAAGGKAPRLFKVVGNAFIDATPLGDADWQLDSSTSVIGSGGAPVDAEQDDLGIYVDDVGNTLANKLEPLTKTADVRLTNALPGQLDAAVSIHQYREPVLKVLPLPAPDYVLDGSGSLATFYAFSAAGASQSLNLSYIYGDGALTGGAFGPRPALTMDIVDATTLTPFAAGGLAVAFGGDTTTQAFTMDFSWTAGQQNQFVGTDLFVRFRYDKLMVRDYSTDVSASRTNGLQWFDNVGSALSLATGVASGHIKPFASTARRASDLVGKTFQGPSATTTYTINSVVEVAQNLIELFFSPALDAADNGDTHLNFVTPLASTAAPKNFDSFAVHAHTFPAANPRRDTYGNYLAYFPINFINSQLEANLWQDDTIESNYYYDHDGVSEPTCLTNAFPTAPHEKDLDPDNSTFFSGPLQFALEANYKIAVLKVAAADTLTQWKAYANAWTHATLLTGANNEPGSGVNMGGTAGNTAEHIHIEKTTSTAPTLSNLHNTEGFSNEITTATGGYQIKDSTTTLAFNGKMFLYQGVYYTVRQGPAAGIHEFYPPLQGTAIAINDSVGPWYASAGGLPTITVTATGSVGATSVAMQNNPNFALYVGATFYAEDGVLHTVTAPTTSTALHFTPALGAPFILDPANLNTCPVLFTSAQSKTTHHNQSASGGVVQHDSLTEDAGQVNEASYRVYIRPSISDASQLEGPAADRGRYIIVAWSDHLPNQIGIQELCMNTLGDVQSLELSTDCPDTYRYSSSFYVTAVASDGGPIGNVDAKLYRVLGTPPGPSAPNPGTGGTLVWSVANKAIHTGDSIVSRLKFWPARNSADLDNPIAANFYYYRLEMRSTVPAGNPNFASAPYVSSPWFTTNIVGQNLPSVSMGTNFAMQEACDACHLAVVTRQNASDDFWAVKVEALCSAAWNAAPYDHDGFGNPTTPWDPVANDP